jgi:AcrR family transcriptional regulator
MVLRVRPANRKESILRAATRHFLRSGYHRTAMDDIAATVGITSTALYRHFRNKRALLTRAVMDALDLTSERIASAGTLDELIDVMTAHSLTYRGLPALWQREARYLAPEDQARILREVTAANRRVSAAIARLRPALTDAGAELLAWGVLAIFDSVSHHRVRLPEERFEATLRSMANAVLNAPDPVAGDHGATDPTDELDERVLPSGPLDKLSRRDRLLVLAAKQFSRRGYAEVGIEDIGAAAGITGPSVYYHFASKADLLSEIIDRAGHATEHYIERSMAKARSAAEAVESMLRHYAAFAFTHRELVWVAVNELSHLPPEQARRHRSRQRDGILRWARLLQEARPELDAPEARVVVQGAIMIVNDVVRLKRLTPREFTAAEVVEVALSVLLPKPDN